MPMPVKHFGDRVSNPMNRVSYIEYLPLTAKEPVQLGKIQYYQVVKQMVLSG